MTSTLLLIGSMQALTVLVGLLRQKGLSIVLGPDGMGVVGTIDQIVLLVLQLGAFGLPFTAMKFMSRAHADGAASFRSTASRFLRLICLLSVLATGLSAVVLVAAPELVGPDMHRYREPLLVAVLGGGPLMVSTFAVHAFASAQRPFSGSLLGLILAVSTGAGAVAGVVVDGILGLYVWSSVAAMLTTTFALAYLNRQAGISPFLSRNLSPVGDDDQPAIGKIALCIHVTMVAYMGMLLAVRYGVLAGSGERSAGLLHAALTATLAAGSLLASMSGLYLAPMLNRMKSANEKVEHANLFAGSVLVLFLLGALPLVLFPRTTVAILYTRAFDPAASMLAGLMAWQCLYQFMNVYMQALISVDELPYMALAATSGLLVAAAGAVTFSATHGAGSIWIALCAGAMLSAILMIGRLARTCALRVPSYLIARLGLCLGAIALGHALTKSVEEWTAMGIAIRLIYALSAVGLLLCQMTVVERSLVVDRLKTLRRRVGPRR